MATLNASLILAQQPYKAPNLDFSSTMVDIAKLKAYQQQQRMQELQYGQAERAIARDEEFSALASQLFTPQAPAASPAPRGLAGGPPLDSGGSPPPAGPSMAGQTLPPAPGPFPGEGAPQDSIAMNSPRGLAEAGGGVAAPPAPPAGLGSAQPGAPSPLLQPLNEQVLAQMYARDPVKASKFMEGHLKMQEQKLATSEKMNEQIYQVLSALQSSPNPAAMYPVALKSLRERGIPIPDSFPKEYNPALIAFKLREHETLKDQLEKAKILHENQKTATAKADELYKGAQAKREGTQAQLDEATTGLRKAEAGRVPMQIKADEALARQRDADAALAKAKAGGVPADIRAAEALVEQRKAEAARVPSQIEADKALALQRDAEARLAQARTKGVPSEIHAAEALAEQRQAEVRLKNLELEQGKLGVPEYVKGEGAYNAALGEIVKREGTAGPPTAAQMEKARNQIVADKATVAASHGKDAAAGAVIKDVLTNASAKGQSGEQVHSVLDDVEDLMDKGVLSSKWEDAWRMYAQSAGLRPDDQAAARTWALQNLGEQLTLAMAGGKLGGQVSDADRELIARASGGMGKLLSPAQQKQAVEQLRRIADRDVEFGNRHIKQYNETKSLPEYGQVRKERLARTITPARLDEALAARPNIKREALIKWFRDNDYIVRVD